MRRARGLLPELHVCLARGKGIHAGRALPGGDRCVAQRKGGRHGGGGRPTRWPLRGGADAARLGAARVHVGGIPLALATGSPGCAPRVPVCARGFLGEAVARRQLLRAVVPT